MDKNKVASELIRIAKSLVSGWRRSCEWDDTEKVEIDSTDIPKDGKAFFNNILRERFGEEYEDDDFDLLLLVECKGYYDPGYWGAPEDSTPEDGEDERTVEEVTLYYGRKEIELTDRQMREVEKKKWLYPSVYKAKFKCIPFS
jgi:hypothetical protein